MKEPRQRLHFLDGLRGVASFYVLLFHAANITTPPNSELSPWMKFVCAWLGRGRLSVVFFIVLSGFSLMLPIARAGSTELVGGFREFWRRRARRILPPYYAALLGSIALILAYNVVSRHQGTGQPIEAALSPGSILSHVFLFHNVKFDWTYRINGPMWSVATEWQIYFVFALLMLPFLRRFGTGPTLVVSWVLGSLPFFLLPPADNFFWACPWFIGSFAFGMAGATIGFSPALKDSWLRTKAPWGTLAWASFGAVVGLVAIGWADSWPFPLVDFVVSVFAFALINACVVRSSRPESKSLLVRFFGSRALVYLGGFSYSLYLVQHPVFRFTEKVAARFPLSADAMALLHLLIVCPLVMLLAWFFAELFERPFTSGGIVLPALRRRFRGADPAVAANPQR